MQLNPQSAMNFLEGYIKKVDELLNKSYKEGEDEKEQLNKIIQNFIRTTFLDGKEKLNDYTSSVNFYFGVAGYEETEQEKQEDYISRLKSMKNHLIAFQEELKLKIASAEKSDRLNKIENETKIRDAESKRRATVVEGKLWGAVIEMLDIQRNELKKRNELSKEIIDIKKELKDLKSIILKSLEKK